MLASPSISSSDEEVESLPLVMLDSRLQMDFVRPKKEEISTNGQKTSGRRRSTAAHTGLQRRSAMRFVTIETSKATGGRPALAVLAVADDVTSGVFAYQRRGFSQFRSCNSSATVFAYECSMSRSSTIGAEKKLN